MKKINEKGFTLIELLAVIVILAILMITAIPAVTNSIAKSRKDTFATNAKNVINAVRTSMASGDVKVGTIDNPTTTECSYPAEYNGVRVYISKEALNGLLERGGDKSSFGREYKGTTSVLIYNKGGDKFDYYILIADDGNNGVDSFTKESALVGSKILLGKVNTTTYNNATFSRPTVPSGVTIQYNETACVIK